MKHFQGYEILWNGKGWYRLLGTAGLRRWIKVSAIDHDNPKEMVYVEVEDTMDE